MAKININLTKAQIETKVTTPLIVGIDLGTTNSLVAYIKENKAVCIQNKLNNSALVPSLVYFDKDNNPKIGSEAKNMLETSPERVIFSIKRLLGKSYQELAEQSWLFSYKIIDNNDKNSLIQVKVGEKFYNPIELSSLILAELKLTAEQQLGQPVSKCVITVPAYFDDNQRQATRDAGKLAGLEVLRVINEPTAAALAYGFGIKNKAQQTIVVYDLGGGTFDCSILRLENSFFEVLSSNGDTFLGGDDIDKNVAAYLLKKYPEIGDKNIESSLLNQLRQAAEHIKKQFTKNTQQVNIEFNGITINIEQQEFNNLVSELYLKTLKCTKNALNDAGLTVADIDEIIMVGGSSRIEYIREQLSNYFGKPVNTSVNPDEVVALGAAIQANILAGNDKDTILLDISPLSLGIETMGGLMDTIISRNTKIPTSLARQYTTSVDGQKRLKIAVFQGERDLVADNRKLGEFVLDNIPPMPAGMPKIEIQFMINTDGILNITAKELRSNVLQSIEMSSLYQISAAEMAKMLKDSISNSQNDMKIRALIETQTEAKLLVAAAQKFKLQNPNLMDEMQAATYEKLIAALEIQINGNEKDAIRLAMDNLNVWAKPFAEIAMDNNLSAAMNGKPLE